MRPTETAGARRDTLYSIAWVDLGPEPIVLSHPDMGERYFTFEVIGIDSNNIDDVGQRKTVWKRAISRSSVPIGREISHRTWMDRSRDHPSPWVLIIGEHW